MFHVVDIPYYICGTLKWSMLIPLMLVMFFFMVLVSVVSDPGYFLRKSFWIQDN